MNHQHVHRQFVQCSSGLFFDFYYNGVKKLLDKLLVDNCLYQLVANDCGGDICREKEKCYDTLHKTKRIDDNCMG